MKFRVSYRIIKEGANFLPEYRYSWFPLWFPCETYGSYGHTYAMKFSTYEEALRMCEIHKHRRIATSGEEKASREIHYLGEL